MTGAAGACRLATRMLLIIGLVTLYERCAWAEEPCEDLVAKAKRARQRELAEAQQFLTELQLTRAQARRLMPIAEKAAEIYVESYDEQAELLPELVAGYMAFAEEDRRNQGFSEEVDRQTRRLHRREIALRDERAGRLMSLEEEAARVLSAGQRERVGSFQPGRRGAKARAQRRGSWRRQPTEEQQELAAAQEELREIHAHRHPRAGNLGRHLLQPAAFAALCQVAGKRPSSTLRGALDVYEHGTLSCPAELYERRRENVAELRGEINNWNLINGLHLNQDQIERIVGLYDSATPKGLRPGKDDKPARPDGRLLLALEQSVEEILNPGQLQVLAEYKACLMPPKNLRDPVRIGQVSDNSGHERWLAQARRLSGRALKRAVARCLEREAKHFGELTPAESKQRRSLLIKTAYQAARMSETEFELSKGELAERIAPPNREQELQDAVGVLARRLDRPGRVARMMLRPDFIEQLRGRGRQLAEGVDGPQINLAAEPKAENCERSCAINPKHPKSSKSSDRQREGK